MGLILTTTQAAQRLGVGPSTVRRLCNNKLLDCYRIGATRPGHRRILAEDLDAFMAQHGITPNGEVYAKEEKSPQPDQA